MQTFRINSSAGSLSATLLTPDNAKAAMVLAHGAGADHQHAHMQSLANAFSDCGIATLRFNFPFKEAGRNRVDSKEISINCIVEAADTLQAELALPLLAGGHSFGGRMVTHAVAEGQLDCKALVLCSFPLHPAGKPSTDRAAHLVQIHQPMLFLSGTRDALAERNLLEPQIAALGEGSTLHLLDTADHSFKTLKRTRTSTLDVYEEAGQAVDAFMQLVT